MIQEAQRSRHRVTVSTSYEGESESAQRLVGSQHIIVTIKAYGYYTGVFGNFRRVGDEGDLSVSGSADQNMCIILLNEPASIRIS